VHDWPLLQRYVGFRSWWAIAQYTVWSLRVVVFPPFFNDNLCLSQTVEYLTIKQFISELGIKAFKVSILLRAARFDVRRLCTNSSNLVSHRLSDELRAVVRLYKLWRATHYG